MAEFDFAAPARILFGPGVFRELPARAASLARRILLVTGRTPRHSIPCAASFAVEGEPTIETVRAGAARAREHDCDGVVAIGGGSALDAGKAIAMLLANGGDPLDYAEVVGAGRPINRPSVPMIAVPTTAGTGSEATRNAVLLSTEHRVKVSLRSPLMLPAVALVDPELTYDLPPSVTAASGMDALSQLIEPFVSSRANPMTDALCRDGIPRAARALRRVAANPRDAQARSDLSLAALWSGMALANAGLGAVHGLAAPIGGMFPAPHGAVCAALLGPICEANLRAVESRQPDRLPRFAELTRLVERGELARLARDLGVPPLREYGIREEDFDGLIEKAIASSSMKGNPVALTRDELRGALHAAL